MDNNDSNLKPQQTGGLKLMTVFIAVLALHVVVIGGFTVYHLMSGGGTDADVVSIDKTKKDMKPSDSTAMASTSTPDAAQPDKITPATPSTTPATDVATTAATPTVPDVTGPNEIVPPTPGPAPLLKPSLVIKPLPTTTTPLTLTPSDSGTSEKLAALAPLTSDLTSASALAEPPTPAATPSPVGTQTPALTSTMASGPVHMPPAAKAPSPTHVDGQTYTVKITDSYKKIATAHHITVAQLKAANHIKGDTLHTGQKLLIPPAKTLVAGTAPASNLDAKPMTSNLSETAPASTATLAEAPVTGKTASGTAWASLHRGEGRHADEDRAQVQDDQGGDHGGEQPHRCDQAVHRQKVEDSVQGITQCGQQRSGCRTDGAASPAPHPARASAATAG